MTAKIFSINISRHKGEPKNMVQSGVLKEGHGLEGDAHAGPGHRQVSLLAIEEIEKAEASGGVSDIDFRPGIFAENITTEGFALSKVKAGDRLNIGSEAVLKITQVGKECHSGCSIMRATGHCIMPKSGIFASVEKGGLIKVYDPIVFQKHNHR
jgi:MOSC domain-containing protein YiiM